MGCEIRYVGTAELKNSPYISARVTCTISFSVKDAQSKDLDIQVFASLMKNTSFEAVYNQEEYSRGYNNICCMVFLKNILMTSSHIVFNIPLDLM